ncbi:hypothetical protein PIB30_013599 [Stylosanthes scabra]|uniref:Uncharacterized protein n=1 Tax=Stylosanthes scabra TaxID=79078 RepID=A0ABU6T6S0_9FABA|nr:hypothetical protein [Stylosanthes scabra]
MRRDDRCCFRSRSHPPSASEFNFVPFLLPILIAKTNSSSYSPKQKKLLRVYDSPCWSILFQRSNEDKEITD